MDSAANKFVKEFNPIFPTLISVVITWIVTGVGAALMLCLPAFPNWAMGVMYAIMAGMLIANSTVGLLQESIDRSAALRWCHDVPWVPPVIGMILGVILMQALTITINAVHAKIEKRRAESESGMVDYPAYGEPLLSRDEFTKDIIDGGGGERGMMPANLAIQDAFSLTARKNASASAAATFLLALALILQQIPEGVMTGISFANAWAAGPFDGGADKAMRIAMSVSLGTWITSFIEGMSIMITLQGRVKPWRSFMFVMIASCLEAISGVVGCELTAYVESLLPFALALVSATTLFVTWSEIIPQANENAKKTHVTLSIMGAFIFMVAIINLFP